MARRKTGERLEREEVKDTLEYLDLLFRLGVKFRYWINEEHPGPGNRSHKRRLRASDFLMVIPTLITQEMVGKIIGRFGAIEMKRDKDYQFIMKHYERLLNEQQNNSTYLHYQDQIRFVEMINANGGLAFFANGWKVVRDKLKAEGVDTTNVIVAGDNK